jgi:hypothetical protein
MYRCTNAASRSLEVKSPIQGRICGRKIKKRSTDLTFV